MDVATRHPSLTADVAAGWDLCRDACEGEGLIKSKGEAYLPKPSGFASMADGGRAAFAAYLKRAQFPEMMAPTIGSMLGIAHSTEVQIDMPGAMSYLHENADGKGVTLVDLHRRITRRLLVEGRACLLADAPETGGNPSLLLYSGPSLINWDEDFFVLDEGHMQRAGFSWTHVSQHRVLSLEGGSYISKVYIDGEVSKQVTPTGQGGGVLPKIPFSVVSAKDTGARIEAPPLIGVATAALAFYQLSADYRHQLYMSGQETLVAINGPAPDFIGAGVVHEMSGTETLRPDLKYVSPSCAGISAHKDAMGSCRDEAAHSGARMFEQNRSQESGEARSLRFRSETANLQSVLHMSCSLLESGLRDVAMIKGLDPESVNVTAPETLLDSALSPQDAMALWQIVKERGLSYHTFYEAVQKGGLASPERDANAEYALIEQDDFSESDTLI